MSHRSPPSESRQDVQVGSHPSLESPTLDELPRTKECHGERETERGDDVEEKEQKDERDTDTKEGTAEATYEACQREHMTSLVLIAGDILMYPGDTPTEHTSARQRPRLTTSNSGAEIMLGLETDDGKSAEVEIDSLESDELQPEEIPKGRVRKTSIVEKLSKSKESELIALSIMESAGQRQREFEKLISEHQELVQEISRTPSAENIVQSDTGRDP